MVYGFIHTGGSLGHCAATAMPSFIYSFIHSFVHSFTRSLASSSTHSSVWVAAAVVAAGGNMKSSVAFAFHVPSWSPACLPPSCLSPPISFAPSRLALVVAPLRHLRSAFARASRTVRPLGPLAALCSAYGLRRCRSCERECRWERSAFMFCASWTALCRALVCFPTSGSERSGRIHPQMHHRGPPPSIRSSAGRTRR
eukprot:GHVU01230486.1.p2 GENE.GHVU01230486.1~~GHVU01230486.1.p2  ORF type:complete len:198 (+),score=1.47 GHVU01230486.1:501-1094(+)